MSIFASDSLFRSRTLWSPLQTFGKAFTDDRYHCTGMTKKGAGCKLSVTGHNGSHVSNLLDDLSHLEPTSREAEKILKELVPLSLCRRWHQDQADGIIERCLAKMQRVNIEETRPALQSSSQDVAMTIEEVEDVQDSVTEPSSTSLITHTSSSRERAVDRLTSSRSSPNVESSRETPAPPAPPAITSHSDTVSSAVIVRSNATANNPTPNESINSTTAVNTDIQELRSQVEHLTRLCTMLSTRLSQQQTTSTQATATDPEPETTRPQPHEESNPTSQSTEPFVFGSAPSSTGISGPAVLSQSSSPFAFGQANQSPDPTTFSFESPFTRTLRESGTSRVEPRQLTRTGVRRQPLTGDCPVCMEALTEFGNPSSSSNVTWCRAACGQNIHTHCFEHWREQNAQSTRGVRCVYCRSAWEEESLGQVQT